MASAILCLFDANLTIAVNYNTFGHDSSILMAAGRSISAYLIFYTN